jgi:hypothetical protein
MTWTYVKTQAQLDWMLSTFNWEDSFIREAHVASPSYIDSKGGTTCPDCLPAARIIVVDRHSPHQAIEILFVETECVELSAGVYLNPIGHYSEREIVWKFSKHDQSGFRCRTMAYRYLGEQAGNPRLHYENTEIFSAQGDLLITD